jgi:hypothetical protein
MHFLIADTFTDSLARLTAQEQKAVKHSAFDLQLDPSGPGLQFHRIDKSKDKNFWSVRVNSDLRLIVHKTASSFLLAYVDHHDAAYTWAERRKLETHPQTGAMQWVEVRERVQEVDSARPGAQPKPKLFDNLRKLELMSFGVPVDWVDAVRDVTEDTIFDVLQHLPQEAQEVLLKLATGEKLEPPVPVTTQPDPFTHPDARRRFRVLSNAEELEQALNYPWEKWTIFLHPTQRQFVERSYSGPARITGSAGTGKTIVAIHRAAHLAKQNPATRVLLTTFSPALAKALRTKLTRLIGSDATIMARIDVKPMVAVGTDLYAASSGVPKLATAALVRELIAAAAKSVPELKYPLTFILGEWTDVVDAWQLRTWEAYRDVARLGRKTRVGGKQREQLWSAFERVRSELVTRNLVTTSDVFGAITQDIAASKAKVYDYVVVDEAQDLGVAEARFLSAMTGGNPNGLFLTGDLGQRIFQQPFSWKALGIDVRGRSHTLKVNYRTSHQIRVQADRLLGATVTDVDGNSESRKGTVSAFSGPTPTTQILDNPSAEQAAVAAWIKGLVVEGLQAHELAIIVRSEAQLDRARGAAKAAGLPFQDLNEDDEPQTGRLAIATMHLAKGLEFRAVAVMACDDEVVPLQARIEAVADDADLEEVYETERQLLYVACTRARDHLLVTAVKPASEFLDDFTGGRARR